MKIHFLGTCSGTEPMPDMHQCSLVFEIDGWYYWFDAGEGCAHRAYTSGIDFMKIRTLTISHPHIDHIGGLAHLLWTVGKHQVRYKQQLECGFLNVFLPDEKFFDASLGILYAAPGYEIKRNAILDGVIYEDNAVRISAVHNRHLREDDTTGFHSYSFLIEAEGKRIIYSGDIFSYSELDSFVKDGCDLIIGETGHHKVCDVCDYAVNHGVKSLIFNHHGREILEGREAAENYVAKRAAASGMPIKIAYDGMVEEI